MRFWISALVIPFFLSPPVMPPDINLTCPQGPPALTRFEIRDIWKQNNKRWFGGKMPELRPGNIVYRDMTDYLAMVTCNENPTLTLSTRIQFSDLIIRQVLLHEMVHVATMDCVHGPKFQLEMRRLIRAGAFDEIL